MAASHIPLVFEADFLLALGVMANKSSEMKGLGCNPARVFAIHLPVSNRTLL